MKKTLLVFLALGLFVTSFGQDYKKRPSLGVHLILNDFSTAANLRTAGIASVLKTKEWRKSDKMSAGLAISYMQGLSNHLDFAGALSGSFDDYPVPTKPLRASKSLLLEGAATVNLKLFTDRYFFNPFLTAGVGAAKYGILQRFHTRRCRIAIKVIRRCTCNYQQPVPHAGY